ncbi:MAG TPA: outer membrane beta-barrel protein [Aeromicrobium sp.]|nr:outer membrane beta-barrel protein [Aeromicrobium sp.]
MPGSIMTFQHRRGGNRMKVFIWSAFACVALALVPGALASAQSTGNGYLFHAPNATVSVRGGYSRALASSDVFDDVTRDLTLDRGDFSSLTIGGDLSVHVAGPVDAVFSAGFSRSKHKSEFRELVDNNDRPIEQTTTFERVPLTASLRYNLAAPGRSIGRLAWIPSRVVPYVGAGVGAMRYRFRQEGDFVNYLTNAVFPSVIDSDAEWTFVAQGLAGVDYNFSPRFGLSLDARYVHARGELGPAFTGYDRIDLSGVSATVGLSVRL